MPNSTKRKATTPLELEFLPVSPAASNAGFPLLVIEFFRPSTPMEIMRDATLRILKQDSLVGRLRKNYDHETDSFTTSQIEILDVDNRVVTKRWQWIELVAVVEPSPAQTYFSSSLNHPHYSVHPMEFRSYLLHFENFCKEKRLANKELPRLVYCDAERDHDIPVVACLSTTPSSPYYGR
jgi:hypothetical protein